MSTVRQAACALAAERFMPGSILVACVVPGFLFLLLLSQGSARLAMRHVQQSKKKRQHGTRV